MRTLEQITRGQTEESRRKAIGEAAAALYRAALNHHHAPDKDDLCDSERESLIARADALEARLIQAQESLEMTTNALREQGRQNQVLADTATRAETRLHAAELRLQSQSVLKDRLENRLNALQRLRVADKKRKRKTRR